MVLDGLFASFIDTLVSTYLYFFSFLFFEETHRLKMNVLLGITGMFDRQLCGWIVVSHGFCACCCILFVYSILNVWYCATLQHRIYRISFTREILVRYEILNGEEIVLSTKPSILLFLSIVMSHWANVPTRRTQKMVSSPLRSTHSRALSSLEPTLRALPKRKTTRRLTY